MANLAKDILVRIKADNQDLIKVLKESNAEIVSFGRELKGAGTGSQGFFSGLTGGLAKAGLALNTVKMGLQTVKNLAEAIVMPGFQSLREIETIKLGMGGILASMAEVNGEALKFADAMGVADRMVEKLRKDAMRTGAEVSELVDAFRTILSPSLAAGMSMEEIREFAVVGTNAVKAMGLPSRQIVQELRDLIQGTIRPATSQVAVALGITKEDITEAKKSADGLFKFLMSRMQGFAPMAEEFPKTWDGVLSKLRKSASSFSAALVGNFDDLGKNILNNLTRLFAEVNTKTGELELNPLLLDGVELLTEGIEFLIGLFGRFNEETGAFEANENVLKLAGFFGEVADKVERVYNILADSLGPILENLIADYGPAILKLLELAGNQILLRLDELEILAKLIGDATTAMWSFIKPFVELDRKILGPILDKLNDLTKKARELAGTYKELQGLEEKTDQEDSVRERRLARERLNREQNEKRRGSGIDEAGIKYRFAGENVSSQELRELARLAKDELKKIMAYWKREIDRLNKTYERAVAKLDLQYEQNQVGVSKYVVQKLEAEAEKLAATIAAYTNQAEQISGIDNLPEGEASEKLAELAEKLEEAEYRFGEVSFALTEIRQRSKELAEALQEVTQSSRKTTNPEGSTWRREVADVDIEGLEGKAVEAISLLSEYYQELTGRAMVVSSGLRSWGGHIDGFKFDVVDDADFRDLEDNVNGLRDKVIKYAENVGLKVLDEYDHPSEHATGGHLDFDASEFTGELLAVAAKRIDEIVRTTKTESKDSFEELKLHKALLDEASEIRASLNEKMGDLVSEQLDQLKWQYLEIIEKMRANGYEEVAKQAEQLWELEANELKLKQAEFNSQRYFDWSSARKDLIGADTSTTDLVKEDLLRQQQALESAEQIRLAQAKIEDALIRRVKAEELKNEALLKGIDLEIAAQENLIAYHEELQKLPDTMKRVEMAGKQALENGLVRMLTDGVNSAQSLGEAFRELVTGILQEMQRVLAQQIVKDFMAAIFGTSSTNGRPAGVQGPLKADGSFATGGLVTGPGSETSDSILAKLSNGEYVLQAQAVRKWGVNFLDALNSGRLGSVAVNIPKFAQGGYVGNVSKTIASEGMNNLLGNLSSNLSTTIPLSVAIVDSKEEAISKFFSTQKGKKVLIDANKSQSTILNKILKINK